MKLSTDVAVDQMRQFLRELGQPLDRQQLLSNLIDETKLHQLIGARTRPSGLETAITSTAQPQQQPPAGNAVPMEMEQATPQSAVPTGISISDTAVTNGTTVAKRAKVDN